MQTINAYASEDEFKFLGSRIFTFDNSQSKSDDMISTRAVAYNPGTIMIDDVLHPASGVFKADKKSVWGEAAANTLVNIVNKIPKIGAVTSTISEIVDLMSTYNSALNSVDYSRDTLEHF